MKKLTVTDTQEGVLALLRALLEFKIRREHPELVAGEVTGEFEGSYVISIAQKPIPVLNGEGDL